MRAWPLVVLAACHVAAPARPAPLPPPALDDAAARAARLSGDPERVVASLGPRAAQLDVDGLVELGGAEAAAGHPAEAARVLASAVQRAETAAGHRGAWRWLDTPRDDVALVAVSPDLAVAAVADESGWIRVWDLGSGTERWVTQADWPNSLVISPDGRWLAASHGNGPLFVWDLATGAKLFERDSVRAPLAFAPDGTLIAGRNERDDGLVRIALPSGTTTPIPGATEFADGVAVTRSLLVSTDEPRDHRTEEIIVRTPAGAELARFFAAAYAWGLAVNDAGDIAVRMDGRIQVFDAHGALRHELPEGRFAMSPGGRRIVIESHGALDVYDLASGAKLRSIAIGTGGALALRGDVAVVAGPDGIATWNIATGRATARFGRATAAEAIAFDPSGAHLAVGNESGEASVWDLATGTLSTIVPRAGLPVTSVAFDGSGALAIGSRPGEVALVGYEGGPPRAPSSLVGVWDLATRAPRWTRAADQLAWLAVRPGTGEIAADAMLSTGNAGSVGIALIARDGANVQTIGGRTQAFAWTPDGQGLVEQVQNGIAIVPLDGGDAPVFAHMASVAAFAPDGKTLALGDRDGRLSLWDVATATPQLVAVDEDGPIRDLAWSPDGAIVATAAGHAVQLWDRHGARLATLATGAPLSAIAYRPDGRLIAAARVDGPVELWAVATATRIATLVAPGGGRGLVLGPDGAVDGELHDDDPLAWQVGARALPARGAWARAASPGLLARLLARVPQAATPRRGLPGAAPPPAPPACYAPFPDDRRTLVDPHPDGDGLSLCVQSDRYSLRVARASPPPACFHLDLAAGAWTPLAPTPRQTLGDAEPAPGAATVTVEGDRASVCRGGACMTVLLPAGISQPDSDVQVDEAGTLLAVVTERGIVTYDVATGRRRARIPVRRTDGTDVGVQLLGHAVMVTTTPCAGPCSSSALYDGATGRLVAAVGGGMDTSYTTPAHASGDVWAFNDGNATVVYQNVRTGRVLAQTALPADDCGPDGCDPTRLVHAGTGVVAIGGAGVLHVLDRGGTLVATYTIPTCAPR